MAGLACIAGLVLCLAGAALADNRPPSALAQRHAERIRRAGPSIESALHPHTWRPAATLRDSAQRAALRAEIVARLRSQPAAAASGTPPILFAEPPTRDSIPPPPSPTLAESLTTGMYSVAVGDLDHDGLPDVASVKEDDSTLVVRRNRGSGNYAPAVHYRLSPYAYDLVLADLDGDGDLDVGVGNLLPVEPWGSYSVLKNLGDGTFGARIDAALTSYPFEVHAADIGQDGRADLVFTRSAPPGVDIVRSRADGGFDPVLSLSTTTVTWYYGGPAAVGDLDADGNPDIAVLWYEGDCFGPACQALSIFFGRVDGTFESPVEYQGYDSELVPADSALTIQDVDGDQALDLVVRPSHEYTSASAPALIRNSGGRRFEAPLVRNVSATPWHLASAHLRSGRLDDLVYSDDASVFRLCNQGNGTFGAEEFLTTGTLRAVVDVSGDGLGDVFVSRSDTTEMRIADGTGEFRAPQLFIGGAFLAIADFTGDQRKDLAVVLPNGEVGVMPGNGAGGFGAVLDFGPAPPASTGWLPLPIHAADLDGDGRADLATVLPAMEGYDESVVSDDSLVVRWSLGNQFGNPVRYDLGPPRLRPDYDHTWPMDLKSGDFNGDGLLDIAVVKGDGGSGMDGFVTMIANGGGRSFRPPAPPMWAGEDPDAAAVADFDGDGRDDLASAAEMTDFTGHFYVFRGLSNGTLEDAGGPSPLGGYAVHHWPFSIATADFNGDGLPDVAVGCGYATIVESRFSSSPTLPKDSALRWRSPRW